VDVSSTYYWYLTLNQRVFSLCLLCSYSMAELGRLSPEFIGQFIEFYRSFLCLWRVKSENWLHRQLQILPVTDF
jgi:hypothetical protein